MEPEDIIPLLPEKIEQVARECGQQIALWDPHEAISWDQLIGQSRSIAVRLLDQGLKMGDKVAIFAANSARYAEVIVAIARAGMCLVPLSTFLEAKAIAKILDDSGTRFIFTTSDLKLVIDMAVAMLPAHPMRVLLIDSDEYIQFRNPVTRQELELPVVQKSNAAVIIYSSGTTGMPKGIVHEHELRAKQTAGFASIGFARGGATLLSTPLSSNWTLTGLLCSLWTGGTAVILPKFRPEEYLQCCVHWRPDFAFLVPTQIERILQCDLLDQADLGDRTVKLSAGSPLRPAYKQEFAQRWRGGLVEIYGMTEGSVTTSLDVEQHPDKLESVGLPSPGVRIEILDEDGKPLPAGQVGEIAGHSPYMMRGYFGRDTDTGQLNWTAPDGTLFQRTGDLGKLDSDGFLYICGRAKDMIISGGQNVYPGDIEEVLAAHPMIVEAAVIGIPSERWGETPLAVVVPRDPGIDKAELLQWANARLGKYQRIAQVAFIEELPRGSLDKVSKKDLREKFAA